MEERGVLRILRFMDQLQRQTLQDQLRLESLW
jgi:hypothetical protein